MEEQPVGIEARSIDYMDGIGDMILFLQAHDLKTEEGLGRFWDSVRQIEADMNAERQHRFIVENRLDNFVYRHREVE